jgi:hypothetical protein
MSAIEDFISGLITMGFLVAGLFFLRFWLRTGERLFGAFCIAFWLLALNQTLVAILDTPRDELSWVYVLRFAAFSLIIAAIWMKNAGKRTGA